MQGGKCTCITGKSSSAKLAIAYAIVPVCALLAACGSLLGCTGEVGYKPPFIPVTFSLNSNGDISVTAGGSITTLIGTFSFSAQVTTPIGKDSTRLSIMQSVQGEISKTVYDIGEQGPMDVCLDGHFFESVGENSISITALDGASTIDIVQDQGDCSGNAGAGGSSAPDAVPATTGATTTAPSGTVSLSATASSSPEAVQVQQLFAQYFDSINTRNYAEYVSTQAPGSSQSEPKFQQGFESTTDSAEVINSITDNGDGTLTADVSFTSQQNAADSWDHSSTCNNWTLDLTLEPSDNGYLIGPPTSHNVTDC
jgi:hypothetical protein